MNRTFIKTNLLVFTGAGLSAESGIATFRDKNGLWENHSVDDVCNYITWKKNFDLVHRFYNERRMQLGTVQPNHAHAMIADWQARYEAVVITQNVDDLLERAGCKDVIHVHGNLAKMHCEACGEVWDIGYRAFDAGNEVCVNPKCDSKRGIKPAVVFFNQSAPEYSTMYRAFSSVPKDGVIVVIGTSGQVINIGTMVNQYQGYKILNNLEPSATPSPYASYNWPMEESFDKCLFMPATQGVDEVDQILRSKFGA